MIIDSEKGRKPDAAALGFRPLPVRRHWVNNDYCKSVFDDLRFKQKPAGRPCQYGRPCRLTEKIEEGYV